MASFCSWASKFESYLVANPEDRSSRDEAQIISELSLNAHLIFFSAYCDHARSVLPEFLIRLLVSEPHHEKICLRDLQQGRLKPTCAATEVR